MSSLCRLFLVFTLCALSQANAAPLCHVLVHNASTPRFATQVSVIIGTDRAGSRSASVARSITELLAQNPNAQINLINLAELPPSIFRSDYFAKKPAAFENNFVNPIQNSDALIFVIPEYDGAVPGILSYFMNHMRAPLQHKQVSLVGLSAGRWGARPALDAFKGTLTHRGARVLGDLQVNLEQIDSKFTDDRLTDSESLRRLQNSTRELMQGLSRLPDSQSSQRNLALIALALKNKSVSVELNNNIEVLGQLKESINTADGTLAYLQFNGPVRLRENGRGISGQDEHHHPTGYGFPVGSIKNFPRQWYLKDNLSSRNLSPGQRIRLEYDSGILVTGTVQKLSTDEQGNLLVLSLSGARVKNGEQLLFDPAWGDFDLAVGDFVGHIQETD